jgi:hypothetical protein
VNKNTRTGGGTYLSTIEIATKVKALKHEEFFSFHVKPATAKAIVVVYRRAKLSLYVSAVDA